MTDVPPPIKLRELDPQFIVRKVDATQNPNVDQEHWVHVDKLEDADGLMFMCPKCYADNGGPVGTHVIVCWFVGRVPDKVTPSPGRWTPRGTSYDDLSFVPSAGRSHSVRLTGGCRWHGFVVDGTASILADSYQEKRPRRGKK